MAGLRSAGGLLQRLPRSVGVILAAAWILVIWKLSSQPSGDEPPNFWRSWMWNCGHAPLFGVLALWAIVAAPREGGWPRLGRGTWIAILLFVIGYAAVDELHQASSPGRTASVFDTLTDGVGAACTLWIASYVGRADSTGSGLYKRLALGLGACILFGLIATLAA